ncbi:hypothetical protein EMIHUDRAFT_242996 [Emiliania huxleyi CCMP1516]|uniref:Mitochondrial carrier protein n=2 Tax=Emiliania huxleyi TaxID=2903 RepID=A0A0D3J735_EMIH1|nr:hypothetical protein EMIHUDRAFT_242996 [Emiliania huxleyi CCMP1516]EOD19320.1 hypothetical protein EMIHUDRAFT_242996 [Emiliania huxleyi CCMP1516]|eukprot:XP_005771749.1 hypothetical protein EMIHUDRAFT_242996 [Emiliania huxleyi CCMP1516]
MQNAASASVGAVVTSLFVTPFEVLKVRQQACGSAAECGMVQLGQTLVRAEGATAFWAGLRPTLLMAGVGALFAGLGPRVLKVAPSCAITICSYEAGKRFFGRGRAEGGAS